MTEPSISLKHPSPSESFAAWADLFHELGEDTIAKRDATSLGRRIGDVDETGLVLYTNNSSDINPNRPFAVVQVGRFDCDGAYGSIVVDDFGPIARSLRADFFEDGSTRVELCSPYVCYLPGLYEDICDIYGALKDKVQCIESSGYLCTKVYGNDVVVRARATEGKITSATVDLFPDPKIRPFHIVAHAKKTVIPIQVGLGYSAKVFDAGRRVPMECQYCARYIKVVSSDEYEKAMNERFRRKLRVPITNRI